MKKSFLVRALEPFLKLPPDVPETPPGSTASARVFRADPRYLTYRYAPLLFGAAAAAIGMLGGSLAVLASDEPVALFIILGVTVYLVFQFVASFALVRLDWEMRYYVVTDRALRIREGAWIIRELTLTFLNVQNVSIEQGPLERLFGISNVVVQTAGGGGGDSSGSGSTSGHRATLRGVSNAPELRDLIRGRLAEAKRDAGLGDTDDHHEAASGGALEAHVTLLREIREESAALARAVRG